MERIGFQVEDADIRKMFSELDEDGSGTIEWSKRWNRRMEWVRGKVGEITQADAYENLDSIAF